MLSFLDFLFVLGPDDGANDIRWKDRVFAERTRSKASPISLHSFNKSGKYSTLLETRVHINCAWIER